ncbi:Uncharacterised protein [uncultured archaeon]|nr:Uncharacterised protein [uncultured archaeon]
MKPKAKKPKITLASETKRKIFHLVFGTLILLLVYFAGTTLSFIVIGELAIIGTAISLLLARGYKIPFLKKIVEGVERKNEKRFPGKAAIYFFISALAVIFVFHDTPMIILAALSVQVYADTAAAIMGQRYGRTKILMNKTYKGSFACFIVAAICVSFFYPIHIALITALIAAIVELIPVDDNLWVPLFAATTIRLLL